jgi:5'-nucleotidase/UDP-sugar diphosphatase
MKKLSMFLLVTILVFTTALWASPKLLTILHVNDTHGHAWQYSITGNNNIGGLAAIATIVDKVKAEVEGNGGSVLVLHAGDINTGVPESDQLDAIPDIVGMNMIPFDAMTLGNHEFDKDKEVLAKQIKAMKFPALCANIVDKDGKPVFTPYIVKELNGLKVAIFGLTTESTTDLEPIYLEGYTFLNAAAVARKLVPELKNEADIVIALSHLGYGEPYPGSTTSDMLAKGTKGIDVIVDGHSHTLFDKAPVFGDTIVVQVGEWGKYVGRLDLWILDGEIIDWEWQKIPVNLKVVTGKDQAGKDIYGFMEEEYLQNPRVLAAMDYFYSLGGDKLNEIVGQTGILLDGERNNVRSKATNLSNLLCDAMIWKSLADFAITNGGGIRASINAGDISYRDILTVLPFGNVIYVVNLTGSDVMELLKFSGSLAAGLGGFPQFGGITFTVQNGEVSDVLIQGKPLEMDKVYKVATNDYTAGGGDGYVVLKNNKANGYDTGFVLADALMLYVQHLGKIESYDGAQRMMKK